MGDAPPSWRAPYVPDRIDRHAHDAICLTNTRRDLLSQHGYSICSRPDYGHPIRKGRRKAMLWSRQPIGGWKSENRGDDG